MDPWTAELLRYFTREKRAGGRRDSPVAAFRDDVSRRRGVLDVLVSPTLPEPAPLLGHLAPNIPFADLFGHMRAFAAFTLVYNVVGAPAISLPMGRSSTGLPIGVQFAAAHGQDRMLPELATTLEVAQPWEALAPRQRWQS